MDLRPELQPPTLDEAMVCHLARLADSLDGSRPGQYDDELTEFNRITGLELPLLAFQGIYKAEDHERWVRRQLACRSLKPDLVLTRKEIIEVVSRIRANCGSDCDTALDFYVELFAIACQHSSGTDLLFYPDLVPELPQNREATPEEIADVALSA